MQTVLTEASVQPKRQGAPPLREFLGANGSGKTRVVIRLPALSTGGSAQKAPPAAAEEVPFVVEEAPQIEPAPELETIFPPAAEAAPAMEMPAMIVSPPIERQPEASPPAPSTHHLPTRHSPATHAAMPSATPTQSPGMAGAGWQLICRGHAFLMQPKVWLACVLSCMGLIIVAFYLQSPAQPDTATKAERALRPAPEPAASPATQIVAPPAEMSANTAPSHGFDVNSTAGFVPPLGETATADQRSADHHSADQPSGADSIRMAADPRLGAETRYDGQATTEPAGATISEVAPLDVPEDLNQEGDRLR